MLVRKALADDSTVKSAADLKGKKVAAAGGVGSAGAYLLAEALKTGGLTIKDVELVNLANPDMPQALKTGAIDAGSSPRPPQSPGRS